MARDNLLNKTELTALQQPLSNDARVLYCLGLRPTVDPQSGRTSPLNYKSLLQLLNASEYKFTRGRQLNALLKELADEGLIHLEQADDLKRNLNGKALLLTMVPMTTDDYSVLHGQWRPMSLSWQPDNKLYSDLAKLMGIIDQEYQQHELGDFIAYWSGRPQTQYSQFQWTQKFVFSIKQKRLAKGTTAKQKIGSQLVQPKAEVIADENARKLVEKYSKSAE